MVKMRSGLLCRHDEVRDEAINSFESIDFFVDPHFVDSEEQIGNEGKRSQLRDVTEVWPEDDVAGCP